MEKLNLIYLCHRIPYPPNKGDKIRSFHSLHHLSQHFNVFLAAFVDDDHDWQWSAHLEKYCKSYYLAPLNPVRSKLYSLLGLFKGTALSLPYYHDQGLMEWVEDVCSQNDIRHALVFSSVMAQFLPSKEHRFDRKVADLVDVDSEKWIQYGDRKPWPLSWLYKREGYKLLAWEKELAESFDRCLFVSSAEAKTFTQLAPNLAKRVGYFNNGVNSAYFYPDSAMLNPYQDDRSRIVFTGAMDYWPNIDAVDWFAREILPQLRSDLGDIQFCIVGSSPSAKVRKLQSIVGVEVTGRVEDVRPYLQFASAVVAPLRIARGVQNKVLEGMAMERPVIVTPHGLEGIEADHGEQVLIARDSAEFIDAYRSICEGIHGNIGLKARQFVLEHFDWDKNLPEVVELLCEVEQNCVKQL